MTYHHQLQPLPNPVQPVAGPKRGMTGGLITAIVGASVVVLCIAPVTFCWTSGFFADVFGPVAEPVVEITTCDIGTETLFATATVEYTLRNAGRVDENYLVSFAVKNDRGVKVGSGLDATSIVAPDEVYRGTATVILDDEGGTKCEVVGVS